MLSALRRSRNQASTPALLPAPRSPRELLLALADYEDARGIDAWLERFDFSGVTPHQIYSCALGRLPESAPVARQGAGYDARQHLRAMLCCEEFQDRLITFVLRALPEKQRLFFVHVPKCAGSDLSSHLMQLFDGSYLGQLDQSPLHIAPERLPWRLQTLMASLPRQPTIAVMGHIGLNWLLSEQLLRFGDVSFTVIRDPIDMAISKVNYVLTLMQRDPAGRTPLVLEWIKRFNLSRYGSGLPDDLAALKPLALGMLRDTRIVPRDNLCGFLGRGDAGTATDLCASANIELTTVSRYDAWLQKRWRNIASARINESHKILTRADLQDDDMEYLHDLTAQDRLFYQRVDAGIASSGQLSIFGAQLTP
ncbi:MAG: hypothetical protein V4650_15635 [Pseudomonadota bacterium]